MGTRSASLALILFTLASSVPALHARSAPAAAQEAYYAIPLAELELTAGELPRYPEQMPYEAWEDFAYLLPYAVLEGDGEALVHLQDQSISTPWAFRPAIADAVLCLRTSAPREVRGRLFLPNAQWDGLQQVEFVVPGAKADGASEERFLQAQAWHYDQLFERGATGGAWFRHLRRMLDEESDAVGPQSSTVTAPGEDSVEAYALFGGGRAISENLQLERELPDAQPGEDVALTDVKGITTPAFDWDALLAAEGAAGAGEPELDPLAALVPADQHALFFPSFAELVRVADEAAAHGAPLSEAAEGRATSAQTRERYERQLCLGLDEATRALGERVVASVAMTGSDPYLRTGSDVAVILEARDAQALGGLLRARQELAFQQDAPGMERVEGEIAGVAYHGIVTPDRSLSSYLARLGDAFVVTNSLHQLARIAETAAAPAESLGAEPEYRFFRQRYARSQPESAFLLLPDAAIRRWCGPRWRIGAKRRTRAAAWLAEIQARGVPALALGAEPDEALLAPPAGAPPLGTLGWQQSGVLSSLHGNLAFLTPIAELDFERVSKEEERLYGLWRDGYEQNWSRFFDPIAARIRVEQGTLALDVSVMPLILASAYGDFTSITGKARLAPDAGDRHAGTLVHFAMALDTEGEALSGLNQTVSAMLSDAGVNLLDWLGGSLAIYVEPSPAWEDLAAAEDREEALENLMLDLESVPIVLHLAIKSPLKLAAFLVALRSLADQTAPGAARWETRSHGESRYVRIASDLMEDEFAIYYATPPGAFLLTLSEKTLQAALDRLTALPADASAAPSPDAPGPWLGESVALDLRAPALALFAHVAGDDLESPQRHAAWNNLPILNEWKRRFPGEDPLALHERLWHEALVSPGGGSYAWNEEWQTMESTVYGHPGAPRHGPGLPPAYAELSSARFGLTLADDSLRARVELMRD